MSLVQKKVFLDSFKLLLEHSRDAIVITDSEHRIIETNSYAVKLYSYSREELQRMTLKDIGIHPSHLSSNSLSPVINIHRKKDGNTFSVEVTSKALKDNSGRTFHLYTIRDITEKKAIEKDLRYFRSHDYLTRVPNRYSLEDFLAKKLKSCLPGKEQGAFLLLNLDNFRLINDTFGYNMGDQILKSFVQNIRQLIGPNDFLARLGGDEFAIYLDGLDCEEAKALADQLRKSLEASELCSIDYDGFCINISVSIGLVTIDGSLNHHKLLSQANIALDEAKQGGKNRVYCLTNDKQKNSLFRNIGLLNLIKESLKKERFTLFYHPVYAGQGEITHYECLIRMYDEQNQLISPGTFIPLAEQFGLMSQIDSWVIGEALAVLKRHKNIKLFVNISGASLGSESLLEDIEQLIISSGIDTNRLGFEITETTAVKDLERVNTWILGLKKLGCSFAIDDFGVGFSSLAYLNRLPVDYLKIDGVFIKDLANNPSKASIIKSINSLAHSFGIKTIAEYVESSEILDTLKDLDVDFYQGFYLSPPLPLNMILTE